MDVSNQLALLRALLFFFFLLEAVEDVADGGLDLLDVVAEPRLLLHHEVEQARHVTLGQRRMEQPEGVQPQRLRVRDLVDRPVVVVGGGDGVSVGFWW